MNDIVRLVTATLRQMWRYRWIGLAVAWVCALGAAALLTRIPDRYEATARVYVDTQTVLKPLMAGLAFQPDIDQQVRMLARTLVSRPNVEKLMDSPEIGLPTKGPSFRDRELNMLTEKIRVVPYGGGNLYQISYRDVNAPRAQRLVEELVNIFVQSSVGSKSKDSEEASRFIDEQIASYESKLVESENRLKEFKVRNFGVAGTSNQDYFGRIAALSDEVNRLRLELIAAEQTRDTLKRELAGEDPQLPSSAMPGTAPVVVSEVESRLDAQKRQLDDLLRRYTDEHPDVIAARRTIGMLEQQKRQEDLARARDGSKGGAAATNPVFQRIRVSLAEAEAKAASLRSQLAVQQGRLEQIRAQAGRVPQVEAEFAQLNRDYEVIRRNYEQLVARREAASLGVKIDQSSQLAEFRLVEPARVSSTPVFPGRKVLAALAVLAAIAAGVAATFAMTRLRHVVDDEKMLHSITGRPVLGSVSMVMTEAGRAAYRRGTVQFAGVTGLFFIASIAWVAWIALQGRI
jgi:polysaccharide chain length determinant protein (PEP-CTERM system associated)